MERVEINTRDGICPAYVFLPPGSGPWPAALVYMDGIGIRPAMLELGEKLATFGYFVLLPDLFYRSGQYAPMDHTIFSDPEKRKILMEKFIGPLSAGDNGMSDTRAFLDFLNAQEAVSAGPIGVTGYCMGGFMSFTASGTYPDDITAVAAYHPARLATDDPKSPHLLAPKIRARMYIGRASDDAGFPDDMRDRLEDALDAAGVDYSLETYPAKHGFVFHDLPVYDAAAEQKHWETLVALFHATLKR